MPMTRRSTPGVSGPRSTRSPTKTARTPAGCARVRPGRPSSSRRHVVAELGQQRLQLGAAAVDVADDVERAGQRRRRSLYSLSRTQRRATSILRAAQHVHLAEALPVQPAAATRRSWSRWRRITCAAEGPVGPGRRCARRRPRSGTSSTIATGQHVVLAGQRDQRRRASRLHVGGVDDGEPAGGQPLGRRCSAARRRRRRWRTGRSRRRRPARGRSRRRSPRSARSARGRTSTCPSRTTPTSTTRRSSGSVEDGHRLGLLASVVAWSSALRRPRAAVAGEHRHLGRRPDLGSSAPTGRT